MPPSLRTSCQGRRSATASITIYLSLYFFSVKSNGYAWIARLDYLSVPLIVFCPISTNHLFSSTFFPLCVTPNYYIWPRVDPVPENELCHRGFNCYYLPCLSCDQTNRPHSYYKGCWFPCHYQCFSLACTGSEWVMNIHLHFYAANAHALCRMSRLRLICDDTARFQESNGFGGICAGLNDYPFLINPTFPLLSLIANGAPQKKDLGDTRSLKPFRSFTLTARLRGLVTSSSCKTTSTRHRQPARPDPPLS